MSVPSSVSFQTLSGDFGPVLGEVARLRLSLFREFPYLYDGTEEAEAAHLQTYVQAPGALLVLARDETAGGAWWEPAPLSRWWPRTPTFCGPSQRQGLTPPRCCTWARRCWKTSIRVGAGR
ncbi:hypothetical protein MSS93_10440 [Deinococcus radiodurans]|nr:hypothetical protein MSS93_10440 [Deinococcus radiodurans]